jgi:hypothetical protein
MDSRIVYQQLSGNGEKLGKFIFFLCRWVAPIFVGLVMVSSIASYIQGILA